MSENVNLAKSRGIARKMAMQAIYQWQMSGEDINTIESQFFEENVDSKMDREYFSELLLKCLQIQSLMPS